MDSKNRRDGVFDDEKVCQHGTVSPTVCGRQRNREKQDEFDKKYSIYIMARFLTNHTLLHSLFTQSVNTKISH